MKNRGTGEPGMMMHVALKNMQFMQALMHMLNVRQSDHLIEVLNIHRCIPGHSLDQK
jgi:hypothetical protein